MSDELRQPSVLDIDALLQPIEGDNPSGESLRYSGIYGEIAEARRADKNVSQGEWQSELKVADYRRVIELAVPVLATQSKDLQIAVWLTEAVAQEHGFAGLRDGLVLLRRLEEDFWDTLHPEIDEGDMEGRANAISWIDTQSTLLVPAIAITDTDRRSYTDWEDSKKFDFPENMDSLDSESQERYQALRVQAETERRVTGEMWRRAKGQTRRRFYEELNVTIDECWDAVKALDKVNEEKFDRNSMPGLSNLQKMLDKVHSQVKKLLDEKRIEEPDDVGSTAEESSNGPGGDSAAVGAGGGGGGGAVQSRKDALKRLGEIANFFQRTEPHSPVAYLVQRAVKWGNMPLESWLQEVIKDEGVLSQLRQTLGLDSGGDGYEAAPVAESGEGW